jgi:hypothetical protein
MSIAQIAATPLTFEPDSPADEAVSGRGFWRRAWDWTIKVQAHRAEAIIRAHPEWSVDPSAASNAPCAHLQRRTSFRIGY